MKTKLQEWAELIKTQSDFMDMVDCEIKYNKYGKIIKNFFDDINVSYSSYCKWRKEDRNIKISNIKAIMKIIGFTSSQIKMVVEALLLSKINLVLKDMGL